jgi:hypothetical protein
LIDRGSGCCRLAARAFNRKGRKGFAQDAKNAHPNLFGFFHW